MEGFGIIGAYVGLGMLVGIVQKVSFFMLGMLFSPELQYIATTTAKMVGSAMPQDAIDIPDVLARVDIQETTVNFVRDMMTSAQTNVHGGLVVIRNCENANVIHTLSLGQIVPKLRPSFYPALNPRLSIRLFKYLRQ